jgi:Fic family protein
MVKDFNLNKPFNQLPSLPPDFSFDDVDILKKVNRANIALSKLSGIAMAIPNRKLLIEPLTVREAVASSGIENINTTVEEVFQASLFDESRITKAQKETLYYRDALLSGYDMLNQKGFLNTNSFIKIHSVLEPGKKGIRKVPGVKIINHANNETLYTPPDGESTIRNLLKNFEDYYNSPDDDVDSLIKVAVCHYQFESIHPFLDGNGRVGRILMVLQLILAKRLELPILFISGYINKNRSEYYRLLREVTIKGNWKAWVNYILTAIEIQSLETTSTVFKIRDLMQKYREIIKLKLPKIYSADLIEYLFSYPFYNQKNFAEAMNLSRNTTSSYFSKLQEIKLLKSIKLGREYIYFCNEFLELLK